MCEVEIDERKRETERGAGQKEIVILERGCGLGG